MSYAVSAALQEAVYQRLSNDTDLVNLVGTAIYDVVPSGDVPELYVALGSETVRDNTDCANAGARHDFRVSVISEEAGFKSAKTAAGAASDALTDTWLTLARGRVTSFQFLRAVARRTENGLQRRIDMTFRAWVQDD